MSLRHAERIAKALLYEGYLLYPYRPSSVKNRQRFNFGVVYPDAWASAHGGVDRSFMQTECVIEGDEDATLDGAVRFLQLESRSGQWQEAIEREVRAERCTFAELAREARRMTFTFAETTRVTGDDADRVVRRQGRIDGELELAAVRCASRTFRIRARLANATAIDGATMSDREETLMHSLVSAHTVLSVGEGGAFVSSLDPPEMLRGFVADCHNVGTWPVLVGDRGDASTVLSSAVVLYDHPEIAPESPGDLFDGTEIDEILSLRILTLTDDEQEEVRRSDDRARALLDRTQSLAAEQLMRMHGAMREPPRTLGERA